MANKQNFISKQKYTKKKQQNALNVEWASWVSWTWACPKIHFICQYQGEKICLRKTQGF